MSWAAGRWARWGDGRLPPRFWNKVAAEPNTGCWLWTACLASEGYGQYFKDRKTRQAHRVSYEALVGPVPSGLELDHLCRVRFCVNPDHLEPVSHSVNVRRGDAPKATRAYLEANEPIWRAAFALGSSERWRKHNEREGEERIALRRKHRRGGSNG